MIGSGIAVFGLWFFTVGVICLDLKFHDGREEWGGGTGPLIGFACVSTIVIIFVEWLK